jgi:hypothetical protein
MLISEGSEESITGGIKGVGRDTVRMMLHAFKLRFNTTLPYSLVYVVLFRIPVSKFYQPTTNSKEEFILLYRNAEAGYSDTDIINVQASDPFVIHGSSIAITS